MGRELDCLVEEKIFGRVPCENECHTPGHKLYVARPCYADPHSRDMGAGPAMYSEDIAAAWLVEERIAELGNQGLYVLALMDIVKEKEGCTTTFDLIHATPEQRCLAAVKAVGVE